MKQYLNAMMAALLLCLSGLALAEETGKQAMDMAADAMMADATDDEMTAEVMLTVNVNEADAETLAEVLKGVGLKRAKAIVAYREEHGKFYTPEELTAVRGIGKSTVSRNLDRITLK